jgi:hypothetical protein
MLERRLRQQCRRIVGSGQRSAGSKINALVERVRSGAVLVLVGSTSKMGAGINVQKRLAVSHHLDVPLKPADVKQR